MGRIYGYARVSTKDQNLDRQVETLKEFDKDIILFSDKESGKDFNRKEYEILKRVLSKGDTLVVKEMDRLGRNKVHIKNELEYFRSNNIRVIILDIPTTTVDLTTMDECMAKAMLEMINNILIEVLATMAEEERKKIKQRQHEGIKLAKAKGKHLGRPKAEITNDFIKYYNSWKRKQITAVKAIELSGYKRSTWYKLVNQYEKDDR